ncbi:MAG: CbtA family protein [Arenicella sp.]
MGFSQIILRSIVIGIIVGCVFSVAQIFFVNPLIFQAETFEVAESHDHGSHNHDEEAWGPADGLERTFYTVSANVLTGIGFAAVILSLMSQLQLQNGRNQLNLGQGLMWGLGGFAAFFVAPAIGLPPEIPGVEAAQVEHRQLWWLFAVLGVGIGILVLFFAPLKFKVLGLVSIVLPYIIGAPHHEGPLFSHPDPAAVEALTAIHQQFIVASSASNFLFWIVLGFVSAWFLKSVGQDAVTDA